MFIIAFTQNIVYTFLDMICVHLTVDLQKIPPNLLLQISAKSKVIINAQRNLKL